LVAWTPPLRPWGSSACRRCRMRSGHFASRNYRYVGAQGMRGRSRTRVTERSGLPGFQHHREKWAAGVPADSQALCCIALRGNQLGHETFEGISNLLRKLTLQWWTGPDRRPALFSNAAELLTRRATAVFGQKVPPGTDYERAYAPPVCSPTARNDSQPPRTLIPRSKGMPRCVL
jgi:hypothetical protein